MTQNQVRRPVETGGRRGSRLLTVINRLLLVWHKSLNRWTRAREEGGQLQSKTIERRRRGEGGGNNGMACMVAVCRTIHSRTLPTLGRSTHAPFRTVFRRQVADIGCTKLEAPWRFLTSRMIGTLHSTSNRL